MDAVILAGGRGTRLASRTNGLPKSLVPINGRPLLDYTMELLARHGISEVHVLCGYEADAIRRFCGDGSRWGLAVTCSEESKPLGTAGAVLSVLDKLPDRFVVLYGDTMVNVDLRRMIAAHEEHGAQGTLFLHPNDHPQDSDLVETGCEGRIVAFHPYPHASDACIGNQVNAALYVLEAEALRGLQWDGHAQDFGKDIFPKMLAQGIPLYGYQSPEYIKDTGTPERLDRVSADVVSGVVARSGLDVKQPAVLLDRDGTINEEVSYISEPNQLRLIAGGAEAMRLLRQAGFRIVIVTNQPVVARGECTVEGLTKIHNYMQMQLSREGAFVDRIYYCPHHPHRGFPGETVALKMDCDCRKPRTGLVKQAVQDLNIDLERSWMVGDRTADVETAHAAGLRSILVRTGCAGEDGCYTSTPTHVCEDLLEAANLIVHSEAGR